MKVEEAPEGRAQGERSCGESGQVGAGKHAAKLPRFHSPLFPFEFLFLRSLTLSFYFRSTRLLTGRKEAIQRTQKMLVCVQNQLQMYCF